MQFIARFLKARSATNFLTVFFSLCFSVSYGQSLNGTWNQDLSGVLEEFMNCENSNPDGINSCNKYVGEALKTVYNIDDFFSKQLGRHMLISEIADYVKESGKWTFLGYGYEQKALTEAQNHANSKKAVIAVYLNEENLGHLSLILPGKLSPSGSWGFQVPNSSSFFLYEPEKSYVGKGLSYAFTRNHIRHVLLYVRNY